MQLSLLYREGRHFSPKWVTAESLYLVNGLSDPVEMQAEVVVYYLRFALKYSGERKMGGEMRQDWQTWL